MFFFDCSIETVLYMIAQITLDNVFAFIHYQGRVFSFVCRSVFKSVTKKNTHRPIFQELDGRMYLSTGRGKTHSNSGSDPNNKAHTVQALFYIMETTLVEPECPSSLAHLLDLKGSYLLPLGERSTFYRKVKVNGQDSRVSVSCSGTLQPANICPADRRKQDVTSEKLQDICRISFDTLTWRWSGQSDNHISENIPKTSP